MQKRKLGSTDLEFTTIGLGTWAIGGSGWAYGWGSQDENDSQRTILEALSLGINWIDTAAVYGLGRAETIAGKALKQAKQPVYIATKCGLIGAKNGKAIKPCLRQASVIKECEESLRRLNVEVIDLYQIHWPMPPEEIEEGFAALLRLKEQGKIRWAGVSNFSREQLAQISPLGHIASLQPPYSLLRRDVEKDSLDWCAEHRCGVVAYSPMQCGVLTGKVTAEWVASLADDDWRKTKLEYLQPEKLPCVISLVDRLREIAAKTGHNPAQLAVAWVLRRSEVTSAIVGARKPGQIREIIAAADWTLGAEDLTEIENAYQDFLSRSN